MTTILILVMLGGGVDVSSAAMCKGFDVPMLHAACVWAHKQAIREASASFKQGDKQTIALGVGLGFSTGLSDVEPYLERKHMWATYCWRALDIVKTTNLCTANDEEKSYLVPRIQAICERVMPREDIRPSTGDVDVGRGVQEFYSGLIQQNLSREKITAIVYTFQPGYFSAVPFMIAYRHTDAANFLANAFKETLGNDLHRCSRDKLTQEVFLQFVDAEKLCAKDAKNLIRPVLKMIKSALVDLCGERGYGY